MKKIQVERDTLLRYVLRHPPNNVVIKLPDGHKSLDSVDLTLCPLPLRLYGEAEKAAAHAKGGKAPVFEFDVAGELTFVGGSSGGVQRAAATADPSRAKAQKTPAESASSGEARAESPASVHARRATTADATPSPPRPGAEAAAASPQSSRNQRLEAAEQSPPHQASNRATPSNNSMSEAEQSRGVLGHLLSTFRGLGSSDSPANTSTHAPGSAGASAATRPSRQAGASPSSAAATSSAKQRAARSGSSSGGLFASLWNRGSRGASQGATTAAPTSVDAPPPPLGTASRMEQLQIPLCGTTPGTMSEAITRQFGPIFESVEERRRLSATTASAAKGFPKPPSIQLCEVVNSAPLAPFLDTLPVFAYDQLVLCTGVLQSRRRAAYAQEMERVYRRVFGISEEQHRRAVANVTPPDLKAAYDTTDPAVVEERRRRIAGLRADAVLLRTLCDHSSDDDFVTRTEDLLYCIQTYPDSPGDTQMPYAVRAMLYAACLLPLYQLDLSTLSPIYEEKDVEHCLALLRGRLGIAPQVEPFCHLHAQLLANDQCGSVEAQAVFLRGVARAVGTLGARSFASSELSPPTKYAYYVLQETFCLAAVPMPWLDSAFSYDMQRSISAVFIETCLALPPCMLSAMLLVEDMPVLPPSASGEAFLLALLEVFVNSGVFRNYAEVIDDDDDGGADVVATGPTGSAAALLQQVTTELDTKQKAYCQMLTRSFPLAMLLLVPGRLRIGAYTVLARHWGGAYPSPQGTLPADFEASLSALLRYLVDGCCGERRTCQSESLCAMLQRAAQTYLGPFTPLVKLEAAAFTASAAQQEERLQLQWATTLAGASETPGDVRRFLRAVFGGPRPPPLCGDAAAQQEARLTSSLSIALSVLRRCMEGLPPAASSARSGKLPHLAVEYESVKAAAAARGAFPALLPGAVHRLHTIVRVKEALDECVTRAHHQYELVRRVTGAPAVTAAETESKHSKAIYDAVLQLCNVISLEILSSDPVRDMLDKFHLFDAKRYEEMKASHNKAEEFAMPSLYPAITMDAILCELAQATEEVCARLDYEPAVRQIHYRVGHNFVARLFGVYVDGANVYLSTVDSGLILHELDAVRRAFFGDPAEAKANASLSDPAVVLPSGAELLDKLYSIVRYVLSEPSTTLCNGGVGVPPLHSLPETSDDSPWCQYVVRRVLDHRKDFKKGMWAAYPTRQRTKSIF